MISNKPYLLRAFYQWIVDSACTPILVIDANHPRAKIPKDYIENGEIVFNVSPTAVRDMKISNECVEFKASFSTVIHLIAAPIEAMLAIYAEENGEGIFFDVDEDNNHMNKLVQLSTNGHDEISEQESNLSSLVTNPKGKPFLRLIE